MTRPAGNAPHDSPQLGAVVADLGANLICVLVILLAIAALKSAPTAPKAEVIAARPVETAPLSGAGQSDLLHHRLRPLPDMLLLELQADGAFAITTNGPIPLADLPPPLPPRAALYVFSAKGYDSVRELLAVTEVTVSEMTVPQALRGPNGFSREFLTLRVTDDPASIREPLLRLLTRGPNGDLMGGDGESGGGTQSQYESLFIWLRDIVKAAFNLASGLITVLALRRIHRRRA